MIALKTLLPFKPQKSISECDEFEKLSGGLADGKSLTDIAEKHKVDITIINREYILGLYTEMEHSKDLSVCGEIAKDHLCEDPCYYTKLQKIEND